VRVADAPRAGRRHVDAVGTVIRQAQVAKQQAAVGVRIRTHAARTCGRQRRKLRHQRAVRIEELVGTIAAQPCFELAQVLGWCSGRHGERDLMRAERAFDR